MRDTTWILFEEFVEFCESKPPEEEYEYFSIDNCPLARFGKSLYPDKEITAGHDYFRVLEENDSKKIKVFRETKDCNVLYQKDRTFGALTKRLKSCIV